jgi:hypothetical protein
VIETASSTMARSGGVTLLALALALAGCGKDSAAATRGPGASSEKVAVGPHADGDHFSVDAAPVGACAAGAECAIAIKVTVRDDFHVNPEYPHKFTAQDAAGVEFLGKDPGKKNVFSKPAGDFASSDPKSGVLTVRFKSQAGSPTVAGTLKLGVCSDQNCLLPVVDLAVPVTVR